MNCPHCANEIPDGSKFCNHCGARLDEEADQFRLKVQQPGIANVSDGLLDEAVTKQPAGGDSFGSVVDLFHPNENDAKDVCDES